MFLHILIIRICDTTYALHVHKKSIPNSSALYTNLNYVGLLIFFYTRTLILLVILNLLRIETILYWFQLRGDNYYKFLIILPM